MFIVIVIKRVTVDGIAAIPTHWQADGFRLRCRRTAANCPLGGAAKPSLPVDWSHCWAAHFFGSLTATAIALMGEINSPTAGTQVTTVPTPTYGTTGFNHSSDASDALAPYSIPQRPEPGLRATLHGCTLLQK